jgi:myosin heavy chain 9/10/11/14
LKAAEAEIRGIEASRELTDIGVLRQRIAEQMDDEPKQYQKDLAERDSLRIKLTRNIKASSLS